MEQVKKTSTGNAFDDILYNSDSDLGSDGEDDAPAPARGGRPQQGGRLAQGQQQQQQQQRGGKKDVNPKNKRETSTAYIRNEGDEPMDLLSRSIAGNVACKFTFSGHHPKLTHFTLFRQQRRS